MTNVYRFLVLCAGLIAGSQAWAQHAHCSYGYQDSSCGTTIATAIQTPTQCSTAAGWTTVAAGVWQGSKFSATQCTYTAPPVCPSGYDQTGPDWNGSAWVNLSCTPQTPPVPTVVSITGFWVWADCGSWNQASSTGPIPIAIYQNNWSDGSITYFQYYFGKTYDVSVDSKGRYYVTIEGDNWDTYPDGSIYPQASLFEVSGGYPGASIPAQPAYMCTHDVGHN